MMPYREQIEQAVAEQAVDLLAYYDGPEEVREHLVSIIPSVGTHCSGISRASIRMVGAKDLSRGILKWMEAF